MNVVNKYRITFEDIAYEWLNVKKKKQKNQHILPILIQ